MRPTFLGVYDSPVLLESRCCMKVLRLRAETVEEPEERELFPLSGSFYELLVRPFGWLVCPLHEDLNLKTNLDGKFPPKGFYFFPHAAVEFKVLFLAEVFLMALASFIRTSMHCL